MTTEDRSRPAPSPDDPGSPGAGRPERSGQDPSTGPAPVLRVDRLVKRYSGGGREVLAVDDVSFEVLPGQMVVLVGPSGCGKTTLLRAVAGLEHPDGGRIEIHGRPVYAADDGIDLPTERRRVSMVFQNYALWPHLSALANVVYPLRADRRHRLPRAEAAERAAEMLHLVGIGDLADQHPAEMSGGQRQRVALARALVAGSDLVLFDEPLSNVDAKVRTHLRLELLEMQRRLGFCGLFVTHDQAEAMELAHHIAVMGAGRIEQFGTPAQVYTEPATRYVADFIGSINELRGTITAVDADRVTVSTALGPVTGVAARSGSEVDDRVAVVWRPERTVLTPFEPDGPNRWKGTIDAALFLGSHTEHVVNVGSNRFLVWSPDTHRHDPDVGVWLSVPDANVRVLPDDGTAGPPAP